MFRQTTGNFPSFSNNISTPTIYAVGSGTTCIPEPGVLALLGIAGMGPTQAAPSRRRGLGDQANRSAVTFSGARRS